MFILGADGFSENQASGFYVLLAFVLETAFFTGLMGGSFGKLLVRLRTVRADGKGYPTLLHALVRQVMVALRSEEHTSELQSLMRISYAVFCLTKTKERKQHNHT